MTSIITVPHPTLRQIAQPVTTVDEELLNHLHDLAEVLQKKDNPKGVGLSAPQLDKSWRTFATLLDADTSERSADHPVLRLFINPEIVSTSAKKTFGDNPAEPILEGCLSIPALYGPVPRFEWIEFKFQTLHDDKLVTSYETFYGFPARVMQHEYDHLEGKLFTDYTLEYDLPLYEDTHGKMKRIKSSIAKKF